MKGTWGKIELDTLNQETYKYLLENGSLGDRINAYEKFKTDSTIDKDILHKLHKRIKKEYSAKFIRHLEMKSITKEEN